MQGMRNTPWLSRVGCHRSWWKGCLEAVPELNLTSLFGTLDQYLFDLTQWWWHDVNPFLAYLAKLGKKWITTQEALKKSIPNKWQNEFLFLPF